jgi:hypothetical protein
MTWRGLSNDKSSLTFFLGRLTLSHLRLIWFPFRRLLRLAGITVEVFLPACTRGRHRINAHRTQTSMPPVGFEPTISVLERAKTVRALDRAATAIGVNYELENMCWCLNFRRASGVCLRGLRKCVKDVNQAWKYSVLWFCYLLTPHFVRLNCTPEDGQLSRNIWCIYLYIRFFL